MKKKLVFIIPTILFLGFLAFKPPAIGSEKGDVVITPTSTFTPTSKPGLRDFDDEGSEPRHSVYERGHEGLLPGRDNHDDDDDHDGDRSHDEEFDHHDGDDD